MTNQPSLNETNISRDVLVTDNCVTSSNDIDSIKKSLSFY